MNTEVHTYIDFIPLDLWRLGVKNSPRLDQPRIPPRPPGASVDIQTVQRNGAAWVRVGSGGISTFDGINPRLKGTYWWKIPQNCPIPEGLKITKNHKDRITSLTHYRVEPVVDMPLSHFTLLLSILAESAVRVILTANEKERM